MAEQRPCPADQPGNWDWVDRILLDDPDEARAFALREVCGSRDDDDA